MASRNTPEYRDLCDEIRARAGGRCEWGNGSRCIRLGIVVAHARSRGAGGSASRDTRLNMFFSCGQHASISDGVPVTTWRDMAGQWALLPGLHSVEWREGQAGVMAEIVIPGMLRMIEQRELQHGETDR